MKKTLSTLSILYMAKKALESTGWLKALGEVDFDREHWLNKAGLTQYRPGARTLSGLSLFTLGALAGGLGALLFATQTGPEFRTQVRERALDLRDRAKDLVQRSTPAAASVADRSNSYGESATARTL